MLIVMNCQNHEEDREFALNIDRMGKRTKGWRAPFECDTGVDKIRLVSADKEEKGGQKEKLYVLGEGEGGVGVGVIVGAVVNG